METLSPKQLVGQALVLFVDGGLEASEMMDKMEQGAAEEDEREQLDALGIADDVAIPDGMSGLRESSLGVIP